MGDNSFKEMATWKNKFINQANIDNPRRYPFLLLGNKMDLEDQRSVTHSQGSNYARDNGMEFAETSALNGSNIEKAIMEIAELASESDTVPFFHRGPRGTNKYRARRRRARSETAGSGRMCMSDNLNE